jgi:alpha-glucosidase
MLRRCFTNGRDASAWADSDDFTPGRACSWRRSLCRTTRAPVHLPKGPGEWYDPVRKTFAAGSVQAPAPLERIPQFVPAGATDDGHEQHCAAGTTSRRARCASSRLRRATTAFTLYEDDGLTLAYRDGDWAQIAFELATSATTIALQARKSGRHRLPYDRIRVVPPPDERRPLRLDGQGIALVVG